ncbi:MAG: L-fucose isomerase [Fimbriimonadales bacterium]|jgi:L-fucose isomerase|nr:L-fucose isomerase [Armatimonadota bacterium]MCX7686434.1 L-fucose isomerase [Fimbriimonadales bacterium]CUU11361.1 L-fucose isomerase [Armatimonadetes bacterium GBS]CUU33862.1 L-fucose isomerase [Armatimonadetes bacterium GXS]CUU35399.1 L-fucose isomerase [Armatimonadetes bacterium DC]
MHVVNAPQNRLRGGLPKVGIRPTIDGRRQGVRESMEAHTMAMAHAVAKLITENLRHACGLPVECVIADTCIGGIAEAIACEEKFEREGVGVSLTVSRSWCYGYETMDIHPTRPKAVWGFNGTERPGAVYLAAVMAAHANKGLPAFSIYGRDVQDADDLTIPPDVAERILQFVQAGIAVATMREKTYVSMGNVSMGIVGSLVDQNFLQQYLGMRTMTVDMVEFVRRMERGIYDKDEYERALRWVKTHCKEGKDYNPPEKQMSRAEKDRAWEISVQMALIARDLMVGNPKLAEMGYEEEALGFNGIAGGFQGQRQWTDHLPNGDFMEAILCSSFDWNGIRQPYILATENDYLNGVCMLFGHLLTGGAQIFADVRTYWSPDAVKRVAGYTLPDEASEGFLHLINSGPAALDGTGEQTLDGKPAIKPWWQVTPEEVERCLQATTWHCAMLEYFRGGGWSTRFRTRGGMPATMFRLNLVEGLGPVMQIAEGYTIELPDAVHTILDERTNPTWPTTWFVPRTTGHGAFRDVYTVMAHWGANHCVLSYGHIGHALITLCSMLRIPVAMHNVPSERIFRPHQWGMFGTTESESADFRACQAYGPLYR